MNKQLLRVLAVREGGAVERCHGTPHIGSYSVGSHSFGALSLVLLLHPNPSVNLIKAVAWHDVAERWLGDVPSPVKHNNPELKRVYELIEASHLKALNLFPDLSTEEQQWLRGVDLMDLYLWCREQQRMGCRNFDSWVEHFKSLFRGMWTLEQSLPDPLWTLYLDTVPHGSKDLPKLTDNFNYILADLSRGD